jgi:transcriptional regulator with XRE-family HTH domain
MLAQAQLGKRIRMLRKARRLTQPSFAQLCNLHASHLSKIERGEANPTLQTLLGIANALGISPSKLFTGIQDSDNSTDVAKAS